MKAIYTLCPDPDSAQRLVDALRVASLDLGFAADQVVVVSGEPYEGYEFSDSHAKSLHVSARRPSERLVGGTCGYLLTSLTQKAYPLPTGGMPIAPAWTNGIIVYELTMLGAILTTLVYLFVGAHLPNFGAHLTDPEIWTGKILVGVTDPPESSSPPESKRHSVRLALQRLKGSRPRPRPLPRVEPRHVLNVATPLRCSYPGLARDSSAQLLTTVVRNNRREWKQKTSADSVVYFVTEFAEAS